MNPLRKILIEQSSPGRRARKVALGVAIAAMVFDGTANAAQLVRRPVVRPLVADAAPTIVTQPASVSTVVGEAATFSVAVNGTAPFSYQWRRNGVAITNATTTSYSIPVTSLADDGVAYSVVVSNRAGAVTSGDALLQVETAPAPATATLGGRCTRHGVTPALSTKAAWDAKFSARYGSQLPGLDGSDETFAWHGHYWLRAYVSMADTFGDTKYLDWAVKSIDHMLANTDGTYGWNGDPIGGSQRLLDSGMISHGIMYFVYLVWNDARFSAYRAKADQYLARIDTIYRSYDYQWTDRPGLSTSTGSYIYATCGGGSNLCSTSALLMYNQGATMVKAGLLIDRVRRLKGQTPDPIYLKRADAVAAMFPRFATLEYGAYKWRYGGCRSDIAGPHGSLTEDTNHSHIDLSLLVWANRFQLGGIDAKVMNGLIGSLDRILSGAGSDNVALHVDGTGAPGSDWDRMPVGYDWIDLAQTSPAVLDKIIRVYNKYLADDSGSRAMLGWAEILRYTHCPAN